MNIPVRMSQRDEGFATGLRTAAQLARAAASRAQREGVGAKWQGAHGALAQLADDLETLAQPPEMPVVTVAISGADVPMSPETAAALKAMASKAVDQLADDATLREQSRAKGYTGDACQDCGAFQLVRNGTCLKCENCGATTGCS